MTRMHRRVIAWIGIVGLAVGQIAVAAQGCGLSERQATLSATTDHCGNALHGDAVPANHSNACEVHCTSGAPSVAAPDLPPVALNSLPVPTMPVAIAVDEREWDRAVLAASSAGPPPLLQYCRLLN
jgi:xanthosine utilization system XapX-like protein